jgi:hypothetical protein
MILIHESIYESVIMALGRQCTDQVHLCLVSSLLGSMSPAVAGVDCFVCLLAELGLSLTASLVARSIVLIRREEYGRFASQEQAAFVSTTAELENQALLIIADRR